MNKQQNLWNAGYITLFFVNMIASISFSMTATIMTLYLCGAGQSTSSAGFLVGAMSVAAMVIRPFSGLICDRCSGKRLLLAALGGILLSMVGYGMTSSAVIIFLLRLLHGVSFSLVTTVTMALVAGSIPVGHYSQGMGYFAMGQTITLALAPGLGLWLVSSFSFQAAFFTAAAFVGAAMLLTGCAYRTPRAEVKVREPVRLKGMFAKEAFWFALITVSVTAVTSIENSFVAVYGQSLSAGNVGWYFTLGAAALFLSRLVFSRWADRYGMKAVLFPGLAAMAVAFILMGFANQSNVFVIFGISAVLKALGLGAAQPVLQAASIAAVSPERRGAAASTYYLGADIGQALAPMLGGTVAEAAGYGTVFPLFAVPLCLTGVLYAFISRRKKKNVQKNTAQSHA